MIELLACAALCLPPSQDEGPDPERVRAAVEALDKAFDDGEVADRLEAIRAASSVVDGEVIELIAKGLRDRALEVRDGSLGALRWMDHPDALESLHEHYKREKRRLKDDPEHAASLLKAIAQHGHPDSIAILTEDVFGIRDHRVIEARILGLGHIRSEESVHALFDLMKKVGQGKVAPYMDEFRLSLMVLTAEDHGESRDLWFRWYNDHKRKLKVDVEEPRLPQRWQSAWNSYWNRYDGRKRSRKREDRGGD